MTENGGDVMEVRERPFAEVLADFIRDPASLLWKIPGVWLIDKPPGPSSNLAVVRARKALGIKRIGHAGTLDPLASGLLLLLAGNATRLFDAMQECDKTYVADFRLGERTDSQDVTGTTLTDWTPTRQPPIDAEELTAALDDFRGDILQIPPMHSALKKDGQPLYKLARKGVTIERTARPVSVRHLETRHFDGAAGRLAMRVSKGFYVRTLIDDLGAALGCGAVMTALRRTGIGPFSVDDAIPLEEMGRRATGGDNDGDGLKTR